MRWLPLIVVFTGCLNSTERDGDTNEPPTDTDVATPVVNCTSQVAAFQPDNGETEVSPNTEITAFFTEPVTGDDPWDIDVIGVEGTKTLAADGLTATFTPDAPLEAETSFQVQASVCESEGLSAFTTRYAVDPTTLPGRTYAVNYGAVNFVSPSIANTLTPADWILVQIDTVDVATDTLTTLAGLGNGATPEPDCFTAFDSGPADFADNPTLRVGPTDFLLPFGADEVNIEDFQMQGRFEAGAGILADVMIIGMLDTRGITTINGVCSLSALTGVPCEPCRDGAPRCLPVQAEADQADYWVGVDLGGTCGLP